MRTNISQIEKFKTLEDIAKSIDHLDKETLKETLAYILKLYIIDKGIEYDGEVIDNIEQTQCYEDINNQKNISHFTDLIDKLKKEYSFLELNNFLIENGSVFIKLDGKKYLISEKNIKKTKDASIKSTEAYEKLKTTSYKSSPDRFKNLEMDEK